MKTLFSRLVLSLAGAAALLLAPALTAAPALSIHEALKIADGILQAKGVADQTFVQSITLQPTAILGGETVWYVEWDASIPSAKEGKRTVGIEIHMDGRVVHVVNARGKKRHVSPH